MFKEQGDQKDLSLVREEENGREDCQSTKGGEWMIRVVLQGTVRIGAFSLCEMEF